MKYKRNKKGKRVMVITCGPDLAYISEFDFVQNEITFLDSLNPLYIDIDNIVDTNRAGDAFSGGFISVY